MDINTMIAFFRIMTLDRRRAIRMRVIAYVEKREFATPVPEGLKIGTSWVSLLQGTLTKKRERRTRKNPSVTATRMFRKFTVAPPPESRQRVSRGLHRK